MQAAGRTAQNADGLVISYKDKLTDCMKCMVIDARQQRRHANRVQLGARQNAGEISKWVKKILYSIAFADRRANRDEKQTVKEKVRLVAESVLRFLIEEKRQEHIDQCYPNIEFERVA